MEEICGTKNEMFGKLQMGLECNKNSKGCIRSQKRVESGQFLVYRNYG